LIRSAAQVRILHDLPSRRIELSVPIFPLAFLAKLSDESSGADQPPEGENTMSNVDVTINDTAETTPQATPKPKSIGKKAKAGSRKETKIAAPKRQVRRTETKAAKVAKNAGAKKAAKPADSRDGTKKDIILELLRRKEGATIAEIAKMTNWQNHSVRGFISGTVSKKMGSAIESCKNDAGERTYRVVG
jgi:Protein of unknown function (DUF3489)